MKYVVLTLVILYGFFANREVVKNVHISSQIKNDTAIAGKLLDSFTFTCDRFAECVCAEAVRLSPIGSNDDTIVVFIECYDKFRKPKLTKDSIYCFHLQSKIRERVILHDPFDKLDSSKRYYCSHVNDITHCR